MTRPRLSVMFFSANQRRVRLYALLKFSFRKCCITTALDGTEDDEIWEEESDSDPFEDLDEMDGDDHLYYGEYFEQLKAEIDPECFENIFGESDSEDFYGF